MRFVVRAMLIGMSGSVALAVPAAGQSSAQGARTEIAIGIFQPTTTLGAEGGYQARLRSAPQVRIARLWPAVLGAEAARFSLEIVPNTRTALRSFDQCTFNNCRAVDVSTWIATLGYDVIAKSASEASVVPFLAGGVAGRFYLYPLGDCLDTIGYLCVRSYRYTQSALRSGLRLGGGLELQKLLGSRLELTYQPTWVQSGRLQHDLGLWFVARF